MSENYSDYKKHVIEDIEACMEGMGCQPILFVGSGLSQRYLNAPTWEGLLKIMSEICPTLDKSYAYYKQSHKEPIAIASHFIEPFKEWAWHDQSLFPQELFDEKYNSDIYLKYKVSNYFKTMSPCLLLDKTCSFFSEIQAFQAINPHSIITTNYDMMLEGIFNEYEPIIGQKILRANSMSIGEIFKIHGCCSEPPSLVLTQNDYDDFKSKKKYLSAKLLAFFAEHPLLFIGYSASDPNIQSILSDIDEIISEDNDIIPNVYLLQWNKNLRTDEYPLRETVIVLDEKRKVRIKCIFADDFTWIFNSFSNKKPIDVVRPKILRALLARTYDLVRKDIPRQPIEVNYETLEHALSDNENLAKLYGITAIYDPSQVNAQFPFSLSSVGKSLGYKGWHGPQKLIEQIYREKNINIKISDNKYHISIRTGEVMNAHKYSQALVDLLKLVKTQQPYTVEQ
ncbi:SIR2 family protein [Solidesulfovibrio sp.]